MRGAKGLEGVLLHHRDHRVHREHEGAKGLEGVLLHHRDHRAHGEDEGF